MKKVVQHTFAMAEADFFSKVFFEEDYARRMHMEALGNASFEIISQSGDLKTGIHRHVVTAPNMNAPKVVQKILGDSIQYSEKGTYLPAENRFEFSLTPSRLADKIQIQGAIWTKEDGPTSMIRFSEVTAQVKIFGAGKVIEQFIADSSVENFNKTARFTERWITDHL